MKIADMNWMQVEGRLSKDKRAVVPMGRIEQHGYLCLAVFPALSYGITPYFGRSEATVQEVRSCKNGGTIILG